LKFFGLGESPELVHAGRLKLLLLAVLGTFIGLTVSEVLARLFLPSPPYPNRQPQIQYVTDRELGFIHLPNQKGWIDEGLVTINALGFRGKEAVIPKPRGYFRIMALGDSTTVGWGVHDHETYPVQLEKLLVRTFPGLPVEVINCGVSGYSTEHEAKVLKKFAPVLDPDLVLLGFSWNDLPYGGLNPDSERVARPGDPAKAPGEIFRIVEANSRLNLALRHSRALYALSRIKLWMQVTMGQGPSELLWERALLQGEKSVAIDNAWRRVEAGLKDIKSVADAYGLPLVIAVIPFRAQVAGEYPNAQYQTKLRQIGERVGVPVVDPLPRFRLRRDRSDELFIQYDPIHPGASGYKIVAESLLAFFRQNGHLLASSSIGQSQEASL
jgi:lysophospholipase L1-like esterase